MVKKCKTMKQLPSSERPYEKCIKYGASYLSDAELLAVIIRTGTTSRRSVDVAVDVLESHPLYSGILGLHYLTFPELTKIDGIGKVKAVQILCVAELTKRIAKTTKSGRLIFRQPREIADFYMEELRVMVVETVYLLMLDAKCQLLYKKQMTMGTVTSSVAAPREIFQTALQYDAVSIILLHNHPSGDPTPSKEDMQVTKRLEECGRLLGIPLSDHIIIGDRQYVSLKERGYI